MSAAAKRPPLWIFIPGALGIILAIAYSLVWRAGAARLEREVLAFIAAQNAAPGLSVRHEGIATEGFPFFLRARIAAPRARLDGVGEWSGPLLFIDALPYALDRIILSPKGEHRLVAADGRVLRLEAEGARFSIAADKTRGWAFSGDIEKGRARDQEGRALRLSRLAFGLAPGADAPNDLALSFLAQGVAGAGAAALDQADGALVLTAARLLAETGEIDAWRAAGGALRVESLRAGAGEAQAGATGSLGLDAEGFLTGAMTIEADKPAGLAAPLAGVFHLPDNERDALAGGLALAALSGRGRISERVRFADGYALARGERLVEIGRLIE